MMAVVLWMTQWILMLRWFFRSNVLLCASASASASITNMCHWWCEWHHMTYKGMLISFWLSWVKEYNDAIDDTINISDLMPVPVLMTSHGKKGHVVPHFDYLDPRNAVMSLLMHLAACDTDAGINGIVWLKYHVTPHFNSLEIRNVMVPLTMSSASWGWCWWHWCHMIKNHVALCCISF